MGSPEDILRLIAATAGIESRGNSDKAKQECEPLNAAEEAQSQNSAEEEQTAFAANTDEMHEIMQKLRMNGLQVEIDKIRAEIETVQAASRGTDIDNQLRRDMADMTFNFMTWWCSFVALMFFIYLACNDGKPPVEAIIALLGTSTISIVGLVGFIVSGLFKSQKKE